MKIEKVLILGSGALQIGQAGEFDYSGSQAIKAMKEEGIKTILINPNIATIQTSEDFADKVYFYPINTLFVSKIIKKEKPDGIMLGFGGQTALNTGIELYKAGILKRYGVKVLGTDVDTIIDTEDRDLFTKKMKKIGVKTAISAAVTRVEDAVRAAEEIGYPVMIRSGFSLGGLGSSVVNDKKDMEKLAGIALAKTSQILVEEYLGGWKEIEYEIMRDRFGNTITICNMENFDPMGVHTGESIVVAPSQTLDNHEYHKLREISIKIIEYLGIVGECNVQFALDPGSDDYRVIELNPRLSRSSALASKATGYPIAFIAAKLGIGRSLIELKNQITLKTTACFEPSLDYVVVKIPRWDLNKFRKVSNVLGSEMKSVGEVMAIAGNFEEALQKAARMLQVGLFGVVCNKMDISSLEEMISTPTDKRLFAIAKALSEGFSIEKINKLSGIDPWFLEKIKNIVRIKDMISRFRKIEDMPVSLLAEAKKRGFSDKQISVLTKTKEYVVSGFRRKKGILPYVKQIDTLAAEFPAMTNYLYMTYDASADDIGHGSGKTVIILGSGAYRIGSSVEFDWCCVNCATTLKDLGYNTIMINYNPETVSTDYDICTKLYFDELSIETVKEIYKKEKAEGIIISMGGQIPNNLALKLEKAGLNIIGTRAEDIDRAEDRNKFSKILDEIEVDQPEWRQLDTTEGAEKFAEKVGYPVLIRPSYVLSGSAMNVAYNKKHLRMFLDQASHVSKKHPVVISKFFTNTKEIEMDAVAKDGIVIAYAISEHIENAGVHSGDATLILPPQRTYLETIRKIKKKTRKIASSLNINGPFNIQFLAKNNMLKVIECNLRASRSFPFVSKVMACNFIELATRSMVGADIGKPKLTMDLDYVGIKAPQFSFTRLKGADPILDVEMSSTGEVGCLGKDTSEALLLAMLSTNYNIPKKGVLFSIGGEKNKLKIIRSVRRIKDMGLKVYASGNTAKYLADNDIGITTVKKEKKCITNLISKGKVDLIINIPSVERRDDMTYGYHIRRTAIDHHVPLITNIQLAGAFIKAISTINPEEIQVMSWDEILEKGNKYYKRCRYIP